MLLHFLPLSIVLAAGVVYAVCFKKLTLPAALTGVCIAVVLFIAFGYTGVAMMVTFFLLGSLATSWKSNLKQQLGVGEQNKGTRTTMQVMANAGVPALLAIISLFCKKYDTFCLVLSGAAFASATADTLSSELGNLYGSRFYDIWGLRPGIRGMDGVISPEGTLIGIAGSCAIAFIPLLTGEPWRYSLVIIAAGFVGNLSDSLLGATLERKQVLNNNAVNLLNTALGAWAAWLFIQLV